MRFVLIRYRALLAENMKAFDWSKSVAVRFRRYPAQRTDKVGARSGKRVRCNHSQGRRRNLLCDACRFSQRGVA